MKLREGPPPAPRNFLSPLLAFPFLGRFVLSSLFLPHPLQLHLFGEKKHFVVAQATTRVEQNSRGRSP